MLQDLLQNYRIVLASASPRRQNLLHELGISFDIEPLDIDEIYPPDLQRSEIAVYLSRLKANAYNFRDTDKNCLLITADTIVWLDDEVLPKPKDEQEAVAILQKLSGRTHEVITGVCLRSLDKMHAFSVTTYVWFKELTPDEIHYYIQNYRPYDKAGAYGIQEWIGYIGIEKIEGSYFNVVGLPVQKLYTELIGFLQ